MIIFDMIEVSFKIAIGCGLLAGVIGIARAGMGAIRRHNQPTDVQTPVEQVCFYPLFR